ncbi:MAG: UDP-N-acetylmuramate dehydrogenase [Nitrococcus sp.]|nr:UDP-N-acetylmuramate dehydrogenase [Nitrococcus sp.]
MTFGRGIRGTLREHEPMGRHTSWRAGGRARRYFEPAGVEDLVAFVRELPATEAVLWLGLGSNLLVRDGGVQATVIQTRKALPDLERLQESRVRVGAGVACAQVARACARWGLQGAEFLSGIPGTIGGALAMNAGAWGAETWERVIALETLDQAGTRHWRSPAEYHIGYRTVVAPAQEAFLGATLELDCGGDPRALGARVRDLLARRATAQPLGRPSCGSVFRNPPGDFAARLIDQAGLKGQRRGGACVSTKHANFILNQGDASASDIETLIGYVRRRVRDLYGVELQTEVCIVGEEPGHG